jgi:hypothetical protein
MALLWDNLAQQLSSVRAAGSATAVVTPVVGSGTSDDHPIAVVVFRRRLRPLKTAATP